MDPNPYAPPKAAVADPISVGLKRRSVILMIVLTLVTFGLYYTIWFFRRRAALNQLNSPRKLRLWPLLALTTLIAVDFVLTIVSSPSSVEQTIGTAATLALGLARIAVGIVMIVQCFIIKDILEDHIAGPEDSAPRPLFVERVKLSGLMTFFFSIFYLQYVINRYIAVRREFDPAG